MDKKGFNIHSKSPAASQDSARSTSAASSLARFLAACLAAALALALVGCSSAESSQEAADESNVETEQATSEEAAASSLESADYSPSPSFLESLPSGDGIEAFSLSGEEAPDIPEDQLAVLEVIVAAIEADGAEVGFVFYDLESGLGLCYGADTSIYGASSFKAPYALYLCEDLAETGLVVLSDTDLALIEAAIIYSNNDAYVALRDSYDAVDFDSWVASVGAEDASYLDYSHYPWYCARSSAKLWTEMYLYLQTGSETSQWLGELLASTETSFLRSAIADTGATVWSKAGWCAGSSELYNSTSDAGIVELDGHTYILSIMTSMPYGDDSVDLYEMLASALFDVRASLWAE